MITNVQKKMQGKFARKKRTVYPIVHSEEKTNENEAVLSIDDFIDNLPGECTSRDVSSDVSRLRHDGIRFIFLDGRLALFQER